MRQEPSAFAVVVHCFPSGPSTVIVAPSIGASRSCVVTLPTSSAGGGANVYL